MERFTVMVDDGEEVRRVTVPASSQAEADRIVEADPDRFGLVFSSDELAEVIDAAWRDGAVADLAYSIELAVASIPVEHRTAELTSLIRNIRETAAYLREA